MPRVRLRSLVPAVVLAVSPVVLPLTSAGAVVPTCQGRDATIVGTNRANDLTGTRRADVIVALGGDDVVRGLAGNDIVCGGDGDDRLEGGGGGNTLLGENGNDVLIGDAAADTMLGGPGNDAMLGAAGNDVYDGGTGVDTASFLRSPRPVTVSLPQHTATGEGSDAVRATEAVMGSAQDDTITGDGGRNAVYVGDGLDVLRGGDGKDYLLLTELGDDTGVNLAKDIVSTGARAFGFEGVVGTGANDVLVGDAAANVLVGAAGFDSTTGGGGADLCFSAEETDGCTPPIAYADLPTLPPVPDGVPTSAPDGTSARKAAGAMSCAAVDPYSTVTIPSTAQGRVLLAWREFHDGRSGPFSYSTWYFHSGSDWWQYVDGTWQALGAGPITYEAYHDADHYLQVQWWSEEARWQSLDTCQVSAVLPPRF